jgi:transposase
LLDEGVYGILDNARIHHVLQSRVILEEVFNGLYVFVPPYSPNLKPIEPCFALVKNWLRRHENAALLDPVGFINNAFQLHAIGEERAASVMGHWHLYFENYNMFLDSL